MNDHNPSHGELTATRRYVASTAEMPTPPKVKPPKVDQLTRTDLAAMTPEQINQARQDGRLDNLLGIH